MKMLRALWMWPLMLPGACLGADFLYVLATPPGQRSEIHWVPAQAPDSARVLVEDLDKTELIHRHRDELWWGTADSPAIGNLVGQHEGDLGSFGRDHVSNIARQDDFLYWITTSKLGSYNLKTGEKLVLVNSDTLHPDDDFSRNIAGDETKGLRGLAIHQDRLYFGDGRSVNSVLLDGSDRRLLGARDPGTPSSTLVEAPFGFSPVLVTTGPGPRGLAVHNDYLIWVKEGAFWQVDLATGEESQLGGALPGRVQSMAVTDEAIYWTDSSTVWRWKHGAEEHEPLYQIGDLSFSAISVVTAEPRPAMMADRERVEVAAEAGKVYQLLFSEDLRSWSPDFVRRHLFNEFGFLTWLSPQVGTGDDPLVWQPKLLNRQAYFTAWQYDLESPFDQDGDGLPDYWERQHFADLSPTPDGDTNDDGVTHLDEARLFLSPIAIDSDDDGLSDAEEIAYVPSLNPAASDTDGDSLADGDELNVYQTDPHSSDTDSDGFTDGFEVSVGSSPTVDEAAPALDKALPDFAEDLLVHFDFESSENTGVINRGQLGGHGRIVGSESYVTRENEMGEASRAIDLTPDPNTLLTNNYIETEFSLEDLGLAADGAEITIALWLRTETGERTSFLSAARHEGSAEAISFQIGSERQGSMLPLRVALSGRTWSSTTTTQNVMPAQKWTHVVWTSGPVGQNVYIDGIRHSETSSSFSISGGPASSSMLPLVGEPKLRLGAVQTSQTAPQPFRGALDDVRIYSRVLPEDAIKELGR